MRRLVLFVLLGGGVVFGMVFGAAFVQTEAYRDPTTPIPARVEDLLARMTLAEKVGQMTQVNVTRLMGTGEWDRGPLNEAWVQRTLGDLHVGSVLSGGGAAPVPNTPVEWAELTNALQRAAMAASRLGIPLIYGVDAVHGHNNVLGATIFPHNLGLAATWDPALVEAVARRTAADVAATGIHWNFAPVADLGRDLRWGRTYETFGQDPLLAAELVAASVRGIQSAGDVAATVKHFLGYGAAADGRDRGDAIVSETDLWTLHVPPFRAGFAAGAWTVMVNSGSVNGVPGHASADLLTGLLRERLGFEGVIVSDWNDLERLLTVHGYARDFADAVALGVNAGIDVYMVPHDAERFVRTLLDAVDAGAVSQERVDDAVRRVLTLKLRLGLFEDPYVDVERAASVLVSDDALAYEAALRSLTLLANDGVLPLASDARVLVTGTGATSVARQMGGWTIGWQGVESVWETPPAVTVLDGLMDRAPAGTSVSYADARDLSGLQAVAEGADAVVVVVGETPYAEGQGDVAAAVLGAHDTALVEAALATGRPTVLVLLAGRPLALPAALHRDLAALVMAFLPGSQAGSALADALYGRAGFSGRLPVAWPADVETSAPIDTDERYPFGFGLGYADFDVIALEASILDGNLEVSVEVTNAGDVAGRETVQVFVWREGGLDPSERLIGFDSVQLEPGEARSLRLELPLTRLAVGADRHVDPGRYVVRVAGERVVVDVR
jgi:beta-glucosidase